jgi:hypothetical protein
MNTVWIKNLWREQMNDFKPTCGNCAFYVENKDKHGTEGACVCNPPTVFPMPARNMAGQNVIQWVTAPHPAVHEGFTCGHWTEDEEVKVLPAELRGLTNKRPGEMTPCDKNGNPLEN